MVLPTFATWLQAMQASPNFERSSVTLASARTVLRDASTERALANLSMELDAIIVFASEPDGLVAAIHNIKDIGSNRFHPQQLPFAILGFLGNEVAVTFKPATFFAEVPTTRNRTNRIPADINTFLETDTPEKLMALYTAGGQNDNWQPWNPKHSILIPIFLAEIFSKPENSNPTACYFAIRTMIQQIHDNAPNHPEMGPDDIEELYSILAFFYLLSQQKIPKLSIQPCITDPWISTLAAIKRARLIGPSVPLITENPDRTTNLDQAPNWQAIVPDIVDLTNRSIASSKTGFDALPEQKKKLILTMSTLDGQNAALQVNPDYQEFLKCKNVKEAEDLLRSSIASKYGLTSELTGAIASNLFLGRFLWSRPDVPNGGYSILLQSRMKATDLSQNTTHSSLEIDLRIQNGDTLSDAIMSSLVKGKLRLPTTIDDLLHQLRNDQRTMEFTFGTNSLLFQILNIVPKCMEDNHLAFDSQQLRNPKFAGMIAHQVDLQKQLLFRQADASSAAALVDFGAFETQLRFVCSQVLSRTFHMELPPEITQESSWQQQQSQSTFKRGQRQGPESRALKRNNTGVRNDNKIPGIVLAEGESWSTAFPPHGRLPVDKVPKFNGTDTPCCARFHIGGSCPAAISCPFAITHDNLNTNTRTALQRFRIECKKT